MSATSLIPTPPPSSGGAACARCRAPLAADARYCLRCGVRQGPAPVELLALVVDRPSPAGRGALPSPTGPSAPAALPGADAPPPEPPAPATVLVAPRPAGAPRSWPFALTALVLAALVVGLLIGSWLAVHRGAAEAGPSTAATPPAAQAGSAAAPAVDGGDAPAAVDGSASGGGSAVGVGTVPAGADR